MAQIQKGTTYSTGDQVTAANLNALADAAILLPGAITDQTAKTVPLAADTILLHSAADTALRKSTLTQLFSNATGIPISTGISGLGTGIAAALAVNTGSAGAPVLFNGALGTPTSGTVTNLTGTASININGTVGATTPSTGAFTTLSASDAQGRLTLTSTTGTNNTLTALVNTGGTYYVGADGSSAGLGGTAYALVRYAPSGRVIQDIINSAAITTVSSTGLAVTGSVTLADSSGSFGTLTGSYNAGNPFVRFNRVGGTENISMFADNSTRFTNNNVERMRIDASGNVGIGTTSPGTKLQVQATGIAYNTAGLFITTAGGTDGIAIGDSGSGAYKSIQSYGGALVLNSLGNNVNIGTTTGLLDAANRVTVSVNGTSSSALAFGVNGTRYGHIYCDTAELAIANGAGSGGYIDFQTNGNERARINSSGVLCVGATGFGYAVRAGFRGDSTSVSTVEIQNESSTGTMLTFRTNGESQVGSISFTASGITYNTSSDYRRKSNVKDLTGSGSFIDALKPRTFDWDTGDKGVGFIAHEFAEVSPSSVAGKKDAVDADGKPIYQAMQASSAEVIANLVAELQSLRQRVAALESN